MNKIIRFIKLSPRLLKRMSRNPDFWVLVVLIILPFSFVTIPVYVAYMAKFRKIN